jgi:hypothetical protein
VSAFIPESLGQRVNTIMGAEVVILVNSTGEVSIIVEEVICTVRDEEPQGKDQPGYNRI